MAQNLDLPVATTPARRRASTAESTGLDYVNSHRIDEDISARIRSLLLSRHQHFPPRTPHTSDEASAPINGESTPLIGFDFSTAKSIGKFAKDSGRLSLPGGRRAVSRSDQSVIVDRKTTEPLSTSRPSFPSLRSVGSATQLNTSNNDNDSPPIEIPEVERSAVSSPTGSKRKFKLQFPKIVLQDKKPSRDQSVKSCIEITPNSPPNDAHVHEIEMDCCPPCDARKSLSSKYITSTAEWPRAIKADPADLACFLAGCPADQIDCEKHTRRPASSTTRASRAGRHTTDDLMSVAESLSRDAADLGVRLSINGLVSGSKIASQDISQRRVTRQKVDGPQSSGSSRPEQSTLDPAHLVPGITHVDSLLALQSKPLPLTKTATGISPRSSVTSTSAVSDKFPHAVQSMTFAMKTKEALSTSNVTTNFSLAGYRSKKKPRKGSGNGKGAAGPSSPRKEIDIPAFILNTKAPTSDDLTIPQSLHPEAPAPTKPIPPKDSESSLKVKTKSSSILSSGSKSARHALLKPSVSEAMPVDTGLPVQPKLAPIYSFSEKDAAYMEGSENQPRSTTKGKATVNSYLRPPIDNASEDDSEGEASQIRYSQQMIKSIDLENEASIRSFTASPPITGSIIHSPPITAVVENLRQSLVIADAKLRTPPPIKTLQDIKELGPQENGELAPPRGEADKLLTDADVKGMSRLERQHTDLPSSEDFVQEASVLLLPPSKENEVSAPPPQAQPDMSRASADTVNADYWGFIPAVNEAVQGAVQVAVQNAVQDVVVPIGADQTEAATAYRKLVARSLNEAAKQADDWLRRPSIWSDVPESEATVLVTPARALRNIQRDYDTGPTQKRRVDSSGFQPLSRQPQPNDGAKSMSPATIQAQGNLVMRPTSPDEMETVPLDMYNKDTQQAFNMKPWKKGDAADYTAVPVRGSSRNHVYSSTKRAPVESSGIHPKIRSGLRAMRRSYERLPTSSRRDLRSTSSAEPFREPDPPKPEVYPKRIRDLRKDRSSSYQNALEGNTVRKNTVQWIKDVLSSGGAYEPRFTELPSRSRREETTYTSNGRKRSKTAPAIPVSELYVGANAPEPALKKPPPVASRVDRKTTNISEAFSRTINDLEALMNEALNIAKQAATTEDAVHVPALLSGAVEVLKCGRRGDPVEVKAHIEKSHIHRRDYPARYTERSSEGASVHESLLSYTASEDFESEDAAPYVAIKPGAAPYKMLKSRNPSGWPPTGRAGTPFPPASVPPSDFTEDNAPVYEDARGAELENIKAADPRSLPPDSKLETTRKPRKQTGPPPPPVAPVQPQPDPMQTNDTPMGFPKPEFRTTEPFNMETRFENPKAPSEKSPRRLSPTKDERKAQEDAEQAAGEIELVPVPLPRLTKPGASKSRKCLSKSHSEDDHAKVNTRLLNNSVPNKKEVRDFIEENGQPPIQPRSSSGNLRKKAKRQKERSKEAERRTKLKAATFSWQDIEPETAQNAQAQANPDPPADDPKRQVSRGKAQSYDGSQFDGSEELDFNVGFGVRQRGGAGEDIDKNDNGLGLKDNPDPNLPETNRDGQSKKKVHPAFSLRGKNHVSLNEHHKGFSMARAHKKKKLARDWSPGRKRFVATVSCVSTALVGIIVGIYAGETPAIQYYIVDLHHYTVLGNVFFFVGLAIPTFFFWPLPLLHGRKPYILGSMALAMPLLFPQALACGTFRDPKVAYWRIGLILPRALMGFCLGFANMNFKSMLTDLFGASLCAQNPHQEHVDEFDVRRHGGGMGVWLGLWTWSALGSIGFGFMIGALIINHLPPAWGFYVSITIIAFVMLLNVLCPEPRRNAFRKSVAEVETEGNVSRRLARGEVKMHMVQTGPKTWVEEFHYGVVLSLKMLRQPGFMVMAIYVAWTYGQMVLNIVLLGALTSKDYKFTSNYVGASVMAIPIGAAAAIPFQSHSLLSKERFIAPADAEGKPKKKVTRTDHMYRRATFILLLPFAGLGYTLTSSGPPIPFILPIIFAGLIGFLSNLALAECHGLIMETFDTSDLQPGMTGRPRGSGGDKQASKRTNYSSFPRIMSAFGIVQSFGYLVGAGASGLGGVLTRHLGTQAATGTFAGILLILSIMLLGVLVRFTDVQIIPDHKKEEMARYHQARRASAIRKAEGIEEDEPWRPIIIGNPHHATRRMNLLELGGMSRFSEIRKKNKLVNENSLEAKHPDRAALLKFEKRFREKEEELMGGGGQKQKGMGDDEGRNENENGGGDDGPEQGDLGGFRDMSRGVSGNGGGGRNLSRRRLTERI